MRVFWGYGIWKRNLEKALIKNDSVPLIHIHGCTFGKYYGQGLRKLNRERIDFAEKVISVLASSASQ